MREYKIPSRVTKVAKVKLEDGTVLEWTKPKESRGLFRLREMLANGDYSETSLILRSSIAIIDQMEEGLSKEQAKYLEDRLRDPEDDFNVSDLRAILDIFHEESSGVPPTSGGDSGEQ